MKLSTLKDTILEVERFLRAAKKLEAHHSKKVVSSDYMWGNKLTGATRRASMDLTRKLADLRRNEQ